jgi:hypothetical protein
MRRLLPIIVALALTACGTQYAFPEKAPKAAVLDQEYKAWKHQLASNPAYHFSILIPNEWKVMQTTIASEPSGEKPLEIALFREPGAWIEDESLPVDGEIVVEVFSLSGSIVDGGKISDAPSQWLKRKLQKTVGEFDLLHERVFVSPQGPVADILVKSGAGKNTVISRLAAIRSPDDADKIFVIACSAQEQGYARVADAFAAAISTFRLENTDYSPPKPAKVSTGALDVKKY